MKKSRLSVCVKYLVGILAGIIFLLARYSSLGDFVADQLMGLTALLLMAEHWIAILAAILIAVFLLFGLLPSTFKKMQRCYPLRRLYCRQVQPLFVQLENQTNLVWWRLTDLISFTSQRIKQPQLPRSSSTAPIGHQSLRHSD